MNNFVKNEKMKKYCFIFLLTLAVNNSFAANMVENRNEFVTVAAVNNSIDDMIAAYDKYVDRYIATMKKVKSGDMSAMADYAKLLKQAQDLQTKIEKCKGQMTEAQLAKFSKVLNKLNKALQDM